MFSLKHLLFLLTSYSGIIGTESKRFRHDYTYYAAVDGWLKLHAVPGAWSEARQRCYLEGAVLASPATAELQAALSAEVNKTSLECGAIHTGVHSQFSKGYFHSIEGVPLSKMAVKWMAGEPDNADDKENCIIYVNGEIADGNCSELLPFVCYKKSIPDMAANPDECGNDDQEYRFYFMNLHINCYKFHKKSLTWVEAFKACSAEGGYLAVINSEEEATMFKMKYRLDFLNEYGHANFTGNVFLGFFKWADDTDDGWRTVHGETLEAAGYSEWAAGQPDNAGAYCGGMDPNGKLHDIQCDLKMRFVCERENFRAN